MRKMSSTEGWPEEDSSLPHPDAATATIHPTAHHVRVMRLMIALASSALAVQNAIVIPIADNALLIDRTPAEVLIHDDVCDCPYIEGQVARMPLRLPIRPLQPNEFDQRLARGDRRHGVALYTPTCPDCHACEPIRIDTASFRFSRTHRRILNQGNRLLRIETGPPLLSRSRVDLYEKHLHGRGLAKPEHPPMTLPRYRGFVVDRFCDTFELRLFLNDELVGVAITDRGADALSAHYTYYDPDYPRLSLGTYAILKQIELAREREMHHLYLGLFIAENESMRYKARFHPHERLVRSIWTSFD